MNGWCRTEWTAVCSLVPLDHSGSVNSAQTALLEPGPLPLSCHRLPVLCSLGPQFLHLHRGSRVAKGGVAAVSDAGSPQPQEGVTLLSLPAL